MRKDVIPQHVIIDNTVRVLAVGLVTVMIAGGAGVLISMLANPEANVEQLAGWGIMGVILFGFPIMMLLLWPRQRYIDANPRQ